MRLRYTLKHPFRGRARSMTLPGRGTPRATVAPASRSFFDAPGNKATRPGAGVRGPLPMQKPHLGLGRLHIVDRAGCVKPEPRLSDPPNRTTGEKHGKTGVWENAKAALGAESVEKPKKQGGRRQLLGPKQPSLASWATGEKT